MKTPSQPRAIYYIVAIQIWEYFSFYGMRALLIRYPYSRRLACRPPARQPHGGNCRGAVDDPRPCGAGR